MAPLQHFLQVHKPPHHSIFHPQHMSYPFENWIIFSVSFLYVPIFQPFQHFTLSSPIVECFLSSFLRLLLAPFPSSPFPACFRHLACHCVRVHKDLSTFQSSISLQWKQAHLCFLSCFAHLTFLGCFTTSSQGNLGVEVYGEVILVSWKQYSVCVVDKSLEDFNTCSKL